MTKITTPTSCPGITLYNPTNILNNGLKRNVIKIEDIKY